MDTREDNKSYTLSTRVSWGTLKRIDHYVNERRDYRNYSDFIADAVRRHLEYLEGKERGTYIERELDLSRPYERPDNK